LTQEWTRTKRRRREASRSAAYAEHLIARFQQLGSVSRATVLEVGVEQLAACADDDARRLLLKQLVARMGPRRVSGVGVVIEERRWA